MEISFHVLVWFILLKEVQKKKKAREMQNLCIYRQGVMKSPNFKTGQLLILKLVKS